MKRIIVLFVFSFSIHYGFAQISLPKADASSLVKNFVKPPAIGDIGKTTSGITDLLGSKLSLPDAKLPAITDAVSGFLKKKQGILGLADTNPTDYLSKFNPLQSDLFGKLKGIMGAAAFTNFLGLKPSGNDIAGNLLSNLFF